MESRSKMGLRDYQSRSCSVMIENSPVSKKGTCDKCKCDSADLLLVQRIMESQAVHFAWWCKTCQTYAKVQNLWIKADDVSEWCNRNGIDNDQIPIVNYQCGNRCAKCGKRGTELHHWAPRALFSDSESWPTDYLCRECHSQWHKVIDVKLLKQRMFS